MPHIGLAAPAAGCIREMRGAIRYTGLPVRNDSALKESVIPDPVAQTQAYPRSHRLLLIGFCAVVLAAARPAGAAPVELHASTEVATAGYFQLRWSAPGEAVVLQEDTTPTFTSPRLVYRGPDNARVLSGKTNGDWYYRARTADSDGAFGDVLEVTVQHHPLSRALAFFAVGALVFLATLTAIIAGARST